MPLAHLAKSSYVKILTECLQDSAVTWWKLVNVSVCLSNVHVLSHFVRLGVMSRHPSPSYFMGWYKDGQYH